MKPRLLIPITVQFSVRYLIRTGLLNRIIEYADPIIVIGWEDAGLAAELQGLGAEVFNLPRKKIGIRYMRLYKQIYQWQLKCINSPTSAIERRRYDLTKPFTDRIRTTARDDLFRLALFMPGYVDNILQKQITLVWQDTNISEYLSLVERIKPDAILSLTPFFIEEELLLRAAEKMNIPMVAAYLSFDNITTRNYTPISFDEYFLWNRYNREELWRVYPGARSKKVTIVGAPQFDFYYDESYLWDESTWRKVVGLPDSRPVILFASTGKFVAPHEGQWLFHLDEAIERGQIHGNPVILFRKHPNDPSDYWKSLISSTRHIIFDEPWMEGKETAGKTNVTRRDIEKLASTLFHCIVHINTSSTMTVDGAIYDRPQIGPAYDETGKFARASRELYLREHYLPITRSGGLDIVTNRQDLIQAINSAIREPNLRSSGRKKLVQEICTFIDGKCTERVNIALHDFLFRN